jgi:hypothetical protein
MAITEQAGTPLVNITDKPATPKKRPEPPPYFAFHRLRKWVQAACVVIFFVLPHSNLVRFDIPRQRLYFMGREKRKRPAGFSRSIDWRRTKRVYWPTGPSGS